MSQGFESKSFAGEQKEIPVVKSGSKTERKAPNKGSIVESAAPVGASSCWETLGSSVEQMPKG